MAKMKTLHFKIPKLPQKSPAAAPGQALGYGLQYTRLTAMLLTAEEGSSCSLEVLDDVAEAQSDGKILLGQTKSSLGANPVSDRAQSLWKTFSNWLKFSMSGQLDCDTTTFEIFVSRPVKGDLVDTFNDAKTVAEATAAIKKARELLWGKAPKFLLKKGLSKEIAGYANSVLEADEGKLNAIIRNFRLTCGSGNSHLDVEKIVRGHPVSSSKVSDIATHMCGWVKREIDEKLEKSLPAVIKREEFHKKYVAYRRAADQDTILKSRAPNFTEGQKLEKMPDTFVQQLEIIRLGYEEKLTAVSDFLRASADRTIWSESGDVDESSFDMLDDDLNRTWENRRRAIGIEHKSKKEEEIGQLLYSECMTQDKTVQGMTAPPHFIPGCFHLLSDVQKIGWHPKFKELLTKVSGSRAK